MTDDNGVVTFLDEDGIDGAGNNRADDLGGTLAYIEVINGVATGNSGGDDYANDVAPTGDGTVSFTINSDDPATGCVRPVVFQDTNNNNQLDLDADNAPTEPFGVGPETTFVPAEAPGGTIGTLNLGSGSSTLPDEVVVNVAKDFNAFVTFDPISSATNTYYYDANDTFRIGTVPVTLAAFEADLSKADFVSGTYADDPDAVSTFELTDLSPTAPEVDADATGNDVVVSVTPTYPTFDDTTLFGDTDSIRIYRAQIDPQDFDGDVCSDIPFGTGTGEFDTSDASNFELLGEFTRADDADPDTDAVFEYEDNDLDPGCYVYSSTVVIDGDESEMGSTNHAEIVDVGVTESVAPLITDARMLLDTGDAAVIDG